MSALILTPEESEWLAHPERFEEFLRKTDVFGHRMCSDARTANRERLREERIERVLFDRPEKTTRQRAAFAEAKSAYFKEMS